MAKLKITFANMFMLVRSTPPVVLLPHGGTAYPHTLKLKGIKSSQAPTGSDFTLCAASNGEEPTPWYGKSPSTWPDHLILNLCSLSNDDDACRIRKELYSRDERSGGSAVCPEALNARFFLPYGEFIPWPNDKKAKHLDQIWKVPTIGKGREQKLRDAMVFECELPDDLLFVLREEPRQGKPTDHKLQSKKGDNVSFFVEASDDGHYEFSPFAKDFAAVYQMARNPTGWPVPKTVHTPADYIPFPTPGARREEEPGDIVTKGNDPERPICGAGQGCPEP